MGRSKNPIFLQGEETCRKVAAILRMSREAFEDGVEWVGWPRSIQSKAYDGDTPCDVWWEGADGYTLQGILERMTVSQTGNKTKVPAYKFLLDSCHTALSYELMSTTVFINYLAWANAPMRTKEQVIDLLRRVEQEISPSAPAESKQFA